MSDGLKIKVGIIGAGAMGSLFAFRFIRAGIDTVLLESDLRTVRAITGGIPFVVGGVEERLICEIHSDPAVAGRCSHLFIFVKSYDTEAAIRATAPYIADSAIVVTLQNGLGNREIIEQHVPAGRVVCGSTTLGAARGANGAIHFGGEGDTLIGGCDAAAVDSIQTLLTRAGFSVSATGDPDRVIWEKAIINASINPLGALLSVPNGFLLESPHLLAIQESVITESCDVAAAMGMPVDREDLLARTRLTCSMTSQNRCSMLQDIEGGRKTEIDSINGTIAEYGRAAGLSTPCNDILCRLVRAREEAGVKS